MLTRLTAFPFFPPFFPLVELLKLWLASVSAVSKDARGLVDFEPEGPLFPLGFIPNRRRSTSAAVFGSDLTFFKSGSTISDSEELDSSCGGERDLLLAMEEKESVGYKEERV